MNTQDRTIRDVREDDVIVDTKFGEAIVLAVGKNGFYTSEWGNFEDDDGYFYTWKLAEKFDFKLKQPEKQEIDHNIDVRYEEDVIKAFDKFIEKWCGVYFPHLIDNDENDGQFMREKIEKLLIEKQEIEIAPMIPISKHETQSEANIRENRRFIVLLQEVVNKLLEK